MNITHVIPFQIVKSRFRQQAAQNPKTRMSAQQFDYWKKMWKIRN